MLSTALQIVMFVSFVALLALVWHVSKWPRWRIRVVVYGWAASILLAGLWAIIMPLLFRGVMDAHTIAATFPEGTFVVAMLVCGWMWPLIVVAISSKPKREK